MIGIIQDYIQTIQADFQSVFHYLKRGCPKQSGESQEKVIHAAVRILLVPVIAVVAINFVASLVTGSLMAVVYLIGVVLLLRIPFSKSTPR